MIAVRALGQGRLPAGRTAGPERRWGVREVLLALLALTYPFHFGGRSGDAANISLGDAIVALCVLWVGATLLSGRFVVPRYTFRVLVFALVAVASLIVQLARPDGPPPYFDEVAGLTEIGKLIGSTAWMIALYALLREDPFRGIRVFSIVSVMTASIFGLITIHESLLLPQSRPAGPFANANLYANYLVLNLLLALMLARLHWRTRLLGVITTPPMIVIPILLVGVLATGSRGALIGGAVGCVWIARWKLPHLSVRGTVTLLLLLVLAAYGLARFWQTNTFIADRVSSIATGEGPNIATREALWGAGYEAFLSSPVLGIGYHQFGAYAEAVHGLPLLVAHNTYVQTAAEVGSIGLAVFLWLVFTIVLDGAGLSRRGGNGTASSFMVAVVLATMTQGLFADVEHFRSLWIAFGTLAALKDWMWRAASQISPPGPHVSVARAAAGV